MLIRSSIMVVNFLHCMRYSSTAAKHIIKSLSLPPQSILHCWLSLSSCCCRAVVVRPLHCRRHVLAPLSPTGSNFFPRTFLTSVIYRCRDLCCRCRHRDSFCNWVSLPLCRFLAHNPPAGLDLLKQSSPPIYSSPVDREEHSSSSDFFFFFFFFFTKASIE